MFWLKRVTLEHDNFLRALEWSRAQCNAEAELRLAANLGRFWHLSGRGNEGRHWLRHALAVAPHARTSARALALNWAGRLATVNGEADDVALLEDSLDHARAVDDAAVLALALRHLSMAYQRHGDVAGAGLRLQEALVAARQGGDRREEAFALVSLGASAEQSGNHDRAADLLQAGLAAAREVGDAGPVGWALSVLGSIAAAGGHDEEAASLLHAALELSLPMGYWAVSVASLAQLGGLASAQADFDLARQYALRCLGVAQTSGDLGLMAAALTCAAEVELRAGRYVAGVRLLGAESAWRIAAPARRFVSFWSWPLPSTDGARAHLGHDAFDRAWRAGASLTIQEAVREALGDPVPAAFTAATKHHHAVSRPGHVSLRPRHPFRALAVAH